MHRSTSSRRRPNPVAIVAVLGVVLALALASPGGATPRSASISAHMQVNSVVWNHAAFVVGTVSPASATSQVVVQRGIGGHWTDRQGGPVAGDGSFSIAIRPSQSGIYALRVRSAGGSVVSATFYFRVRTDFTPFAGTWTAHEQDMTITTAGVGTYRYPDFNLCPDCSEADAPPGTITFQLSGDSGKSATGTVTGSSDAGVATAGEPAMVTLAPADPGTFLLLAIAHQNPPTYMCNETAATHGSQCGA